MAIIESNNNQYLAVGIIKLCGLEAVEAVFGVDERNKSSGNCVSELPEICAMLRYRDIQCRSLFTSVSGNVQTFTRKIAMVNDFDSSFGYRNLRIHKSAICEPLQGNARVTQKN
ncbi:hypothetical protein ACVXG9_23830 [Escherichia coli]